MFCTVSSKKIRHLRHLFLSSLFYLNYIFSILEVFRDSKEGTSKLKCNSEEARERWRCKQAVSDTGAGGEKTS